MGWGGSGPKGEVEAGSSSVGPRETFFPGDALVPSRSPLHLLPESHALHTFVSKDTFLKFLPNKNGVGSQRERSQLGLRGTESTWKA